MLPPPLCPRRSKGVPWRPPISWVGLEFLKLLPALYNPLCLTPWYIDFHTDSTVGLPYHVFFDYLDRLDEGWLAMFPCILNGAVRPSWGRTAVDGVKPSRPVFLETSPMPRPEGLLPGRPPWDMFHAWLGNVLSFIASSWIPEYFGTLSEVREYADYQLI